MGPAIPYIDLPEWKLHFLSFITSVQDPPSIKPFGTLVAIGVYIGSIVAVRHAKQRGLDIDKMDSFIFWVVGLGFVGGHVFDAIFYTPEKLSSDGLYIFKIWAGLSSFGGFLGAIIGAVAYKLSKRDNILPYVDTVCSAFPLAWVFGRSGCASVHDHPGLITDKWYAVKPPDPSIVQTAGEHFAGCSLDKSGIANGFRGLPPGMGRLDLGLTEMLLTIPLALAFWWLWKSKPRAYGFFAGWMCVAYAPVRFVLDFLREDQSRIHEADPRYFHLTPAQWACFGLVALGFYIVHLGKKQYGPVPATYDEMQELARAALLEQEGATEDDLDRPKVTKKKKGKKKKKAAIVAKTVETKPASDESGDEETPEEKSDAADEPEEKAASSAADEPEEKAASSDADEAEDKADAADEPDAKETTARAESKSVKKKGDEKPSKADKDAASDEDI